MEKNRRLHRRGSFWVGAVLSAAFAGAGLCGIVRAEDWNQFRGPNRDGISKETGLLKQWPNKGPALAWKQTGVGVGYSSVSVVKGKIYTMGDIDDSSYVICLAEDGGKKLWSTKVGKPGGNYEGTRCTPTVDGDRVYALGQFGDLVCLNSDTGEEIWRKSLTKDLGGNYSGWNYTESLIVDGDRLICCPGGKKGTMAAINKKTGEVIWRSTGWTDGVHYSSPILVEIDGVKQYVQLTADSVAGIETETGKLLWRAPRKGQTAVIPTPIYHDHHVFVTSGYGVGCDLFKISSDNGKFSAERVYSTKEMVNHHGGVILLDGKLYGYSDGKGWMCMDFLTGRRVWAEKNMLGKGAIAYADGQFYLRDEGGRGTIMLIDATSEGFKERGSFPQPDRSSKNSWPHPVIANGKLYIRDMDVLLCYDIKAK